MIRFAHKGQSGVAMLSLSRDELVEGGAKSEIYTLTRAQETDLPQSAKLSYIDGVVDYRQAVVEAKRQGGATTRVATAQLPIVLGQEQAQGIADSWLHDVWSGREKAGFALPPSKSGAGTGGRGAPGAQRIAPLICASRKQRRARHGSWKRFPCNLIFIKGRWLHGAFGCGNGRQDIWPLAGPVSGPALVARR